MKVTLLLADYAQVAEGKLTVVGGGWSVTGPNPVPFAIAMYVQVPWDQANVKHAFSLELVDADGNPVMVEGEGVEQPIAIAGEFEVGRPAGVKPGSYIDAPLAINLSPPPPLPPGGQYEWRLSVDGQMNEDWRLPFTTRPFPQTM